MMWCPLVEVPDAAVRDLVVEVAFGVRLLCHGDWSVVVVEVLRIGFDSVVVHDGLRSGPDGADGAAARMGAAEMDWCGFAVCGVVGWPDHQEIWHWMVEPVEANWGLVCDTEVVSGVVVWVFVVKKVCKAMNAMDHLEEKLCMHVY